MKQSLSNKQTKLKIMVQLKIKKPIYREKKKKPTHRFRDGVDDPGEANSVI